MSKVLPLSAAIAFAVIAGPAKSATISYSQISTSISVVPLGLGGFGTTTFDASPFPGAKLWRFGQGFPSLEGTFGAGRQTEGRAVTSSTGFLADDGFFLDYALDLGVACTADDAPVPGTCTPTLAARADTVIEFTTDMDATLHMDGFWAGGNVQTNLADTFSFLIREFPSNARIVEENDGVPGVVGGTFSGSISVFAGSRYRVDFLGGANASSASNSFGSDSMRLLLAASIVPENANAEAFSRRANEALAPVPLPGALPLFLVILAGLGLVARERRNP